jgi:hypothetical protein
MKRRYGAGIAIVAGVAAGVVLARRWQLRWGANAEELAGALPGDELIARPDLTATRAITARAPAARVWPWIAQLGQARGGFYSYDFLENLVGCNIHSAARVVPEWQDIKPGDKVGLHPEVAPRGGRRGPGTIAAPARRGPGRERPAALRLHLGLRAPAGAGRDDPADRAGEIRLHTALGTADR